MMCLNQYDLIPLRRPVCNELGRSSSLRVLLRYPSRERLLFEYGRHFVGHRCR